jgi:hypothetical protein
LAPSEFWELTPYELNVKIEAYNKKKRIEEKMLRLIATDNIAVPIINSTRKRSQQITSRQLLGVRFFMDENTLADQKTEAARLRASFAHIIPEYQEAAPEKRVYA